MAGDAVEQVKARLDIVDVVGGYVRLQRAGRRHVALCPFHSERTPSFTVSQERQAWYCFGCQEGGDVLSFVERIERVDFRQALELLAARAGVDLEVGRPGARAGGARRSRLLELHARAQSYFEHVLWRTAAGEPGRALLAERAVEEAVARRFGIGFAPAGGPGEDALTRYLVRRASAGEAELTEAGLAVGGRSGRLRDRFRTRLIFPVRDERGRTIAFGGRALGEASPKYLNSPESAIYVKSRAIFGLDLARTAISQRGAAVVVEGYFDVVSAHRAGVVNAVASSGTALGRDQVRTLRRLAPAAVLCFDGDPAGAAATSRAVDIVAAEGMAARIVVLPEGLKDPDEAARRDPAAFARAVEAAEPEWKVLLDRAHAGAGEGVEGRRAAAERAVGVLARIPDASTRELYIEQAARRLGVSAEAVASDVARRLAAPRERRAAAVVAADIRAPSAAPEGETPSDPPSHWEEYLAALAVQRPSLARVLTGELGLDAAAVGDPRVRRLLTAAAEAGDGPLPLHLLPAEERRLAARLLVRPLPELDPDGEPGALRRGMSDAVALVREAAGLRAELSEVRRELRRAHDEGREDEEVALAARLSALAAAAPRLRRTVGRA